MTTSAPIIGAFPLYPPLELFHSLGLTPAVLWGMDRALSETPIADRHLQPYTCALARRLVDHVLANRGERLAGLFHYNACDTLRNLPEIIRDGLAACDPPRALPLFRLHLPARLIDHGYTGRYLYDEIDRLILEVEKTFGTRFSAERFMASVEKFRAMRGLVMRMQELAAAGALAFADVAAAVEAGAMKTVEEQTADYTALVESSGGPSIRPRMDGFTGFRNPMNPPMSSADSGNGWATPDIPVVLSGILAPPAPVLRAIGEAGMTVVANDLAALHRAHAYTPKSFAGPVDYYLDFYQNHFPCPTLLHTADRRIDAVCDLVKSSGARGVIFAGEKFCEYEYFEYPQLEVRLAGVGARCLPLEFSLGDTTVNPTRLAAFAELLRKGGV